MTCRPIETKFYLTPTYVSRFLSKYYILHWQGSHLLSQISEAPPYNKRSYILHQDTLYLVKTEPHLPINPALQYKLSFRLEKFMPQGICLVREISSPEPTES